MAHALSQRIPVTRTRVGAFLLSVVLGLFAWTPASAQSSGVISNPTTVTISSPGTTDPDGNAVVVHATVLECNLQATASTNATNCKASAGYVYGYEITNSTSTWYYVRLYNLASAPTCSSATGFVKSIGVPPNGIVSQSMLPVAYSTGMGFCVTLNAASTDNNNAAAGVIVSLKYK